MARRARKQAKYGVDIKTAKFMGLGKRDRKARLRRVAVAIQAAWKIEARASGLKSTLGAYLRGVKIEKVTDKRASVVLKGAFPNMLENGRGAFDMRGDLLKSKNKGVKSGRNGLYMRVPFRHTTKGIRAKGGSRAMKAARSLSPSVTASNASGSTLSGGRLGPGYHARLTGMVRSVEQKAKSARSKYMTWRTISQMAGNGWLHPGIKGKKIANRVVKMIPKIMRQVL